MSSIDINDLKSLIWSSPQPLLIKNQLSNWTSLNWSLSKWFSLLEPLVKKSAMFRCGENTCSKEPQWESKCHYKYHLIDQFINQVEDSSSNQWMYFDYKHVAECMVDEIIEQVQSPWEFVGLPELSLKETTLWIGSKGAHTPCHSDTYGCNLVAQVIGRKQWILFPPSDPGIVATQTRVPYEESSVYSGVNFVCGKHLQESSISASTPYIITLEPGDILLVPHRWWHYVEHLSTGLSLNTWIPLNDKRESIAYLDEWLVRYLVKNMIQNLSEEEQTVLLNPNEKDYLRSEDRPTCLEEITHLLHLYQEAPSNPSTKQITSDSNQRSSDCKTTMTTETSTTAEVPTKNVIIEQIKPMSKEQFYEFCKNKCTCLENLEETRVKEISKTSSSVKRNSETNLENEDTCVKVNKTSSSVKSNSETQMGPSSEEITPGSKSSDNYCGSTRSNDNVNSSLNKALCSEIIIQPCSAKSPSGSDNNEIGSIQSFHSVNNSTRSDEIDSSSNISQSSNESTVLNMSDNLDDVNSITNNIENEAKTNIRTNETSSKANTNKKDQSTYSKIDPNRKSIPEKISKNSDTIQEGNEISLKRVRSLSPKNEHFCESRKSMKLSETFSRIESQPITEIGEMSSSYQSSEIESNLSKHSSKSKKESREVGEIVSNSSVSLPCQTKPYLSIPSQTPDIVCSHRALFQAFTHPDVIQLMRQKLLQQLQLD
ncbi:hypothetical protein WDU94_013586 [Cyamophila willieti]